MDTTNLSKGKTKTLKFLIYTFLIVLAGISSYSCKRKAVEQSHMVVRMTDAPGNFQAVMVDVQGVEVTGTDGSVIILNTKAGIYNLLDFANGKDTIIATGDLNAGSVSQIRLILGTNNTVTVDNAVYALSTPSAMQSGLKIQVHKDIEAGVTYMIQLDFDANQSIVLKGNGEYQLKPVIRTTEIALTGSIRGSISVVGTIATVTATSNGISYSSVTNSNGEFLIAGLPAGTYDITITPPSPMLAVTVTGKIVVVGATTNIGLITL